MKNLLVLGLMFLSGAIYSQGNPDDYYYQIPKYPDSYTAGTVAARVVDGLGFRYYWGTEGLREEDMSYRPSEGARNIEETVDHIARLTRVLLNAVSGVPNSNVELDSMSLDEKRTFTLENIRLASEKLKSSSAEDLQQFDMIFSPESRYPFWNLLNGPIADAINHVGQIITLRRTNGNPIYQNISVLQGKVRGE